MRPSSQVLDRIAVSFDDGHAVAAAGLILPATVSGKLGLEAAADALVGVGYRPGRKAATVVHAMLAGGDCIDDVVRHEALWYRAGCETSPLACRSRPEKAEGSLALEVQGRVGAALTTTGRISTARWCGSG